ncbi:MAG: hypothetical protein OEV62_06445, partial [Actinomycetota bacterium]|nr:hypothetical protein [Actinomycetota bacterium]
MKSPPHVVRRLGALGALALATLLLSGCFTLRMDLALQADDTVDGSVVLAVDKSLAALAGGEDALLEGLTSEGSLFDEAPSSGDVQQREYREGDLIGVEYVLSGIPVEEFSSQQSGDLSISRDGDRFVVTGNLDMAQPDAAAGEPDASQLLGTADISVSITFPGEVVETNGQVDGRTVTWEPQVGQANPITAVGMATGGPNLGLWLGVGLVALLVVVAGVSLVVLRRRPAATTPPEGPVDVDTVLPGAGGAVVASEVTAGAAATPAARATQVIPVDEQPTQAVEHTPGSEAPTDGR